MKTKEIIELLDPMELVVLRQVVGSELFSDLEAEAPILLGWAAFQIKERNIYRLKRTAFGWWYLKNIFLEVKEKVFQHHPLRVVPCLWFFDEKVTIETRRDIIFVWESRSRFISKDIERNMIPNGELGYNLKAEEGIIVNIDNPHHLMPVHNETGEYLGTIAPKSMMLDHTFRRPSDEQRVILEKVGELFPEQEDYSDEEIDIIAETILAKTYVSFDQAIAYVYKNYDVEGVSGFVLNRCLVNPSKYRKVGMDVTESGKRQKHWHIVVRIPEPDKNGLTTIICPKAYMGMVIGKGGVTIKKIEAELGISARVVEYSPEKHQTFKMGQQAQELAEKNINEFFDSTHQFVKICLVDGDYMGQLITGEPAFDYLGFSFSNKKEGVDSFRHPNSPILPNGTLIKVIKIHRFPRYNLIEYTEAEK